MKPGQVKQKGWAKPTYGKPSRSRRAVEERKKAQRPKSAKGGRFK